MKKLAMVICLLGINALTFAESIKTPLLVVQTGALANRGKIETCEIFKTHPLVAPNLEQIREDIRTASSEELKIVAVFYQAQVPSVEIYANESTIHLVPMRVDLKRIYSNISEQLNPSAQALIAIAEKICH